MPQKRECGGDRPRHGHFMIDNLYEMLINKASIGLRVYYVNDEEKTSRAVWPPIIDEQVFAKVQETLKSNYRRKKARSNRRYPYVLSGLCFCGQCGDRLPGKSAWGNGGKIGYYEHGWSVKRQAYLNKKVFDCKPHRIQAKRLEPAVWEEVVKLRTDPEVSKALIDEAHKVFETKNHVPETDRIRNKVCGIGEQIEALAEHLSKIPKGVSPAPVFAQMQKLEVMKTAAQKELEEMANAGYLADEPMALKDYQSYLAAIQNLLSFAEAPDLRAKIIQRLVHKVEVLPDSFRVHYYAGKSAFIPLDPEPGPPPGPDGGRKTKEKLINKNPAGNCLPSPGLFLCPKFPTSADRDVNRSPVG